MAEQHAGPAAQVDFQRPAVAGSGVVERLEYDPNRSARIALVRYPAGAAPARLQAGGGRAPARRVPAARGPPARRLWHGLARCLAGRMPPVRLCGTRCCNDPRRRAHRRGGRPARLCLHAGAATCGGRGRGALGPVRAHPARQLAAAPPHPRRAAGAAPRSRAPCSRGLACRPAPRCLIGGLMMASAMVGGSCWPRHAPKRAAGTRVQIHNVELLPGRGGKLARAAGTSSVLVSKGAPARPPPSCAFLEEPG